MTRTRKRLLTVAALTVVLFGCGTDSSQTPALPSATDFVLREWSITPPTTRLKAGKVKVTAVNRGSETHELVIVRASSAASLPTKRDGSVDEDKISEADKPGELPDLAAGKTATKTLNSPPATTSPSATSWIRWATETTGWATVEWATAGWDTSTIASAWSPSSR